MPFANKNLGGGGFDPVGGQRLDQGQKEKLNELGVRLTPVSTDSSVLNNTVPTTRQVIPGTLCVG